MADRPRVLLAMYPGFEPFTLRPVELERLARCADLLSPTTVRRWDDDDTRCLLADADVILGHWGAPLIDADVLDHAPDLALIAYMAGHATLKDVVTRDVFHRGITVTTGASANGRPVAEYTVAMILLANKDAFSLSRQFTEGRGRLDRLVVVEDLGNIDCRVGIIGASRIGRTVIELLRPYDLEVVVSDPYLDDDEAAALGVARVELDELMRTSAVVSVHAPDLPSTRGMITAELLASMPDGATLVNTARGRLLDHPALEAELVSGRIRAVLDVTEPEPLPPDSPLWDRPNVVLTPHIGGAAGRELRRLTDLALGEIERYGRGEPPAFPVTADELDIP